MTKQHPRTTRAGGPIYALAARLSGHRPRRPVLVDEAYTIPTERARSFRSGRFKILMDEIGLRDTVDPCRSYFIENPDQGDGAEDPGGDGEG